MREEQIKHAQRHAPSTHQLFLHQARPRGAHDLEAMSDRLFDTTVMPIQFYRPPDRAYKTCGEVALLYAVLEEAINCFQRGTVVGGRRAERLAREAEQWFFTNDDHWLFSFVNICAMLRLEPGYIRAGLKRWRQGHPTRLQRSKRQMSSVRRPLRLSA